MTTENLPGTDAARHGTGGGDTRLMVVMHDAFRRDLVSLARAADGAAGAGPDQQRAVAAGWQVFKRQLHAHHTTEDEIIWPALRTRFAHSESALSVLDAMEEEHERVDPLLTAVDDAFARRHADGPDSDDWPGLDRLGDIVDVLVTTLAGHLTHEENDALPLIGTGLTAEQWAGVGRQIARRNGMAVGSEMFAWMLDGIPPEQARPTLAQLPAPLRVLYRAIWRPRYTRTPHW
jgi:iron-sulfur cluster repair protein YtfE (RIC family)